MSGSSIHRFVVISAARSGSTWLIDKLNSHPAIKTYEELFLQTYKKELTWAGERDIQPWKAHWAERNNGSNLIKKPFVYFSYLDNVYRDDTANICAIGFKFMYHQIKDNLSVLAYFKLKGISIIHLIRSNYLNVLLSEETRKHRGIAHSVSNVAPVKITLDSARLVKELQWKENKVNYARMILKNAGLSYMEVLYEDLELGDDAFLDILKFLNMPGSLTLSSNLKKLNNYSHQDLIENYDDVEKALAGTKYQALLRH